MDSITSELINQVNTSEISATSLRRLLLLHGLNFELAAVSSALKEAGFPEYGSGKDGLKKLDICLSIIGSHGRQLAMSLGKELDDSHLPVLIHYEEKSWVLVELHSLKAVLDSGDGDIKVVNPKDIENSSIIWLKPSQSLDDTLEVKKSKKLLFHALYKRKKVLTEVIIATILTSLLTIATSLFAQQIYDRVIPSFAYSTLWALVSLMGILIVFDFLLKLVRSHLLDSVSKNIDQEISQQIFQSMSNVRLDAKPRSVGTIAAQISGLDSARSFYTSSVLFTLAEVPFAILFTIIIAFISGPMAWIYVVAALLALTVGLIAQMNIKAISKQQLQNSHTRNGLLIESIAGAETIKSLSASWRFARHWRTLTNEIAKDSLKSRFISSFASSFAASLSSTAYVSVIVFGVYLVESGKLTVGGIIATTILGGRIVGPIANGLNLLTQSHMAKSSLKIIDAILQLPQEMDLSSSTASPDNLRAEIKIENLKFFYSQAPIPDLDIPSLQLNPGDKILLMGPPGSGKSTLLRLLAGLYKPASGRLLMDGVDFEFIDSEKLRSLITLLPQDVQLFKGTLRQNLNLAGVSQEGELLNIIKSLGLDGVVADHPRGIDRPIAEGGSGLSVGQRQLCGLARVMLKRPRVWLLDEPTSSLDINTERRVLAALDEIMAPDDILILVTHRPTAVEKCSRMILMQRGKIVGDGDREALHERLRLSARDKKQNDR